MARMPRVKAQRLVWLANYGYVAKTLLNWTKERCRDRVKAGPSLIMEPIANSLTQPQIGALAAYLNHLE